MSSDHAAEPNPGNRRIVALDGLRGLMTIFVLVSHYFAEVPSGFDFLAIGWIAVDMFFVLSGLLVGRLILDKGHHANFLAVFYVRRVCRTFPIYFVCLIMALAAAHLVPSMQNDGASAVPVWSYFLFVQNVFMAVRDNIGLHFLAPTWTMAVEEQFYLVAPAALLATPRRYHLLLLPSIATASVGLRIVSILYGASPFAILALFPTRADSLTCGLMAAVLLARQKFDVTGNAFRVMPMIALIAAIALKLVPSPAGVLFTGLGHLIVAVAAGFFLISLVEGAPEARRFRNPVLLFFGNTSYAIYLTHLPILWVLHRVIRHAEPSLADCSAWGVTLIAMPICVAVAWALTKSIEEPFTSFGRRWAWSSSSRPTGCETRVGLQPSA